MEPTSASHTGMPDNRRYWIQVLQGGVWSNHSEYDEPAQALVNLQAYYNEGTFEELRLTEARLLPNGESSFRLLVSFSPGELVYLDDAASQLLVGGMGGANSGAGGAGGAPSPQPAQAVPVLTAAAPAPDPVSPPAMPQAMPHTPSPPATGGVDFQLPGDQNGFSDAAQAMLGAPSFDRSDDELSESAMLALERLGSDSDFDDEGGSAKSWVLRRVAVFFASMLVLVGGLGVFLWMVPVDDWPLLGQLQQIAGLAPADQSDEAEMPDPDPDPAPTPDTNNITEEDPLQPLEPINVGDMGDPAMPAEQGELSIDDSMDPPDSGLSPSAEANNTEQEAPVLPVPSEITPEELDAMQPAPQLAGNADNMDNNMDNIGGEGNSEAPASLIPDMAGESEMGNDMEVEMPSPDRPQDMAPGEIAQAESPPALPDVRQQEEEQQEARKEPDMTTRQSPDMQPEEPEKPEAPQLTTALLEPSTPPPLIPLSAYRQLMLGLSWEDTLPDMRHLLENCQQPDDATVVCKLDHKGWLPDVSAIAAQFDQMNNQELVGIHIYGQPIRGEDRAQQRFEEIVAQIKTLLPQEHIGYDTRRNTEGIDFFAALREDSERAAYFSYWPDDRGRFPTYVYAKLMPLSKQEGYYHILIGRPTMSDVN